MGKTGWVTSRRPRRRLSDGRYKEQVHQGSPSTVAKDSDSLRVPAEVGNIVFDPVESSRLVQKGEVAKCSAQHLRL
ncbi:hypothetical protein E2C01_025827 [Portunus trituberculatus]|uniref:Uncharacterized protein n=1 Tax=Portunus trituberculatus TaxID=210409 RepID=A0A5B7EJ03_PORTR|nr:hypothetical protein [Portunus trituberculatus]